MPILPNVVERFLFSGGRSYEFERVRGWLADAGFTKCRRSALRQPGFSLMVAEKEI